MTLGNHDCAGNASAQILYTSKSKHWKMPARYYSFQAQHYHDVLQFIVLDSCSLVCAVSKNGKGKQNDRCTGVHVPSTPRQKQVEWLRRLLERPLPTPQSIFVVVSHWPIFSAMGNGPTAVMISDIQPLLQKAAGQYKVIWFNGHDHSLQHIQRRHVNYFISGGGGFKLHPQLKTTADGAYIEKGTSMIRSKWNELPDVDIKFQKASFGFLKVEIDQGRAHVAMYESKPDETAAALIYTTVI